MVSVTSASHYIMSASHYHPRYQSRSLMYIHGLIPRNFAVLAEAVPIGGYRLEFPNQNVLQSLEIIFILANRADPDVILHSAAFHLG